jgi:hypothetical protein
MPAKEDRITIRFDRALGKKIRALAAQRGLSVAEYCRLMCCLEILHEEPGHPFTVVQQQLKETLSEVETFGQLEPQHQVDVMRRSLETVTAMRQATNQLFTWLNALVRASDAYTRQKGGGGDARP